MKPVIKKQTHYSVLLMRDDGEVRSFRMKNTTLRFLVLLFLGFMLVGSAGIGAGYHYWKRYAEFMPEYRNNERELAETRRELMDLRNLKAVVTAQNNGTLPVTMNTEVGVETPMGIATATVNGNGNGNGSNAVSSGPVNGAGQDGAVAFADESGAGLVLANATAGVDTGFALTGADSAPPSLSGDSCPVRVNEFSAQATSQQTLRIRYDLSVSQFTETGQDNGPVAGSAKYIAVFTNGTRLDLAQQSPVNARFAISRMKPMMATSRLPQGYTTADIAKLDIVIELTNGGSYKETYPFPQ